MKNKKHYIGVYKSLYEYLGHAAGGELGQKVAYEAAKNNIKIQTKEIENPIYKGTIQMYPNDFLIDYFKNK
jgi:hypothetical protein